MKKGDIVLVESFANEELLTSYKGRIMWVFGSEVSVQHLDTPNGYSVFAEHDPSYKITMLQESSPSFQSQVANLSDEELQASINELRAGRAPLEPTATKPKKEKKEKLSDEDEKLLAVLSTMSNEEVIAFKAKYGL